jgi:hypothetical protein
MGTALTDNQSFNRLAASWAWQPSTSKHVQLIGISTTVATDRGEVALPVAECGPGMTNSLPQNLTNGAMQALDF